MNQIFKTKNGKPKEEADHQSASLELFMRLITSRGKYPFPKQDISERLIVIPFTPRYTSDHPKP